MDNPETPAPIKMCIRDSYWGYRITPDILELRNLVAVASLIVDCAMRRNESRGLHFNTCLLYTSRCV